MELLPTELLERVLALLPPAELIVCREVCVQWRAVVRTLEADDARYKFACALEAEVRSGRIGYASHVKFNPALRATYAMADESVRRSLDQDFDEAESEEYECSASGIVHLSVTYVTVESFGRYVDGVPSYLVPCQCGRPLASWFGGKGVVVDGLGHERLVPLARWRHLASDSALAQKLADVCAPLDGRLFLSSFALNADQPPWFPYFLHVQSRPVGALLARASSVDDIIQALQTDAEMASAFEARSRDIQKDIQSFAEWWPLRHEWLNDTVEEWTAARSHESAAVFVNKSMNYLYGPTYPWLGMTSAQLTEGLEAQQRHFDAMVDAFTRLVRFPFVINAGTDEHYCIVGLSPSANLVGVRITLDYR